MTKIISVTTQKGGAGKTTTAYHLSIALANSGKKVLAVDNDPQGHFGMSFGYKDLTSQKPSIKSALEKVINGDDLTNDDSIIKGIRDNIDLLPANIEYAGMELTLANTMSREKVLKDYLEFIKKDYDYIIIDCNPSLGLITMNALVAADSVLIPVQAERFGVDGLSQLIKTLGLVKKRLNPNLGIEGVLFTIADEHTNNAKEVMQQVKEAYAKHIHFFKVAVPSTVRFKDCSGTGVSIFEYKQSDKMCQKGAAAYLSLAEEVLANGK